MNALHFTDHLFVLRNGYLIWCCDGAWLLNRLGDRLDWARLFDEIDLPFKRNRLGHYLRFLRAHLGAKLPGPVPPPEPLVKPDFFSHFEEFESTALSVLFGARGPTRRDHFFPGYYGLGDRIRYLLAVLFPSKAYMRQRYHLPEGDPMAGLYLKRTGLMVRRLIEAAGRRAQKTV